MRIFASALLSWVFLFFILGLSVDAFTLPDTGQDKCYDTRKEIPCGSQNQGQDAEYRQGPGPVFMDHLNVTVLDLLTGLTWQKTVDGVKRDWPGASSYCEALELGGYTDWRLPTRHELLSLPDYGKVKPAIDTTYFPECPNDVGSGYWSITPVPGKDAYYIIDFLYGGQHGSAFTESNTYVPNHVRCVRAGATLKSEFVDKRDGTITDTVTGRMWQKGYSMIGFPVSDWEKHLSYCENLELAGYDDWRLPNIRELETILDDTQYEPTPTINAIFDAPALSISAELSSSTTCTAYPDYVYIVNLRNSSVNFKHKDNERAVRCVRLGLQQPNPNIKIKSLFWLPLLLE